MFRLVSVECYGCRYKGKPNTYYDDNTKRPVFNQCGHSLCTECAEVFHNCPICDKEIKTIENFTARSLLDDYKRDAMRIFKNWWNATGNERETCTRCYEPCENLRLCLSCYSSKLDFIVVYGDDVNEQKPWMNSEMRQERRKQIEAFRDKSMYSEVAPDADPEEIELKIYFHCDFSLFANLACCSSCILDHHGDHLVNTREELEPIMDVFKQSASKVAVGFLANQINQMKSSCKIKMMRLHRTTEILSHFANNYFRSQAGKPQVPDIHISRRSTVNKFFKLLPWDNLDGITRGDVDEIIGSLEYQMSNLNSSEECHCSEIWDGMQLSFYGNQIEKEFARVIEGLNNQKVVKCPFPELEFQKTREEAIQTTKLKLPLIYTVFCWNYKDGKFCGMFDNLNHKPCRCPNCQKPSCLQCLSTKSTKRCPFCGAKYDSTPANYEPEISNETLDLVNFYKNNFLELIMEWWHCDASKLGFCLQCNSYSTELEICVFCELDQKPSALRTNTIGPYHRSDPLFYNFRGLKTLPIRWQCADCNKQLIENWVHKSCEDSVLNGVSWKRGCAHLNSRLSYCELIREEGCPFKVIGLKDIQKYETAMKVSMIGLVYEIAKVAIKERVFYCERRKPIFGSCGHTICLECVEKNVNRECPICETSKAFVNKTVNYTSLQIIEDSKNNYWEFMKKWWSGTGAGEGSCSRCPDKKPILRLCLTCDKNRCCQRRHGANRLRLGCDVDLLNLATQVVCTGCFYKYHDGHQMIRLDRVDYFKDDLKMATSEIILTLFRDWMKKKEITTKCKLRHIRIEMAGRHLWKALEKKTNSREGQCGWLMEQIKINFIKKGVANLDRQLEQLSMITEECECNRLYEKMVKTGYRSSGGMQYDFELFAIRCIKSEQLECPLYFEPNKSHYKMLIEKTGHMVSIKSKNSIPLTDYGGNCPLCVLLDHDETKCLEYYTINCIEIYENWWKSEMPALETLCFRCLNDLNHFKIRMSCKYRQNQRMKYGRKRGRFMDHDEDSDVEECDNPNCSLRNAEYWKFSIKDQTIGDASRIVRGGIKSIEGFLNCKLRRMRLMNIYDTISYRAHGFTVEYLSKWSKDEVAENCQRVTDSIEVLKSQWNEFRFGNGNETADEGSKCRCTHLWEQEKLVLDRVYDKIARYRLASFVEGCPLTFDHGINVDELLISNQIDRVVI